MMQLSLSVGEERKDAGQELVAGNNLEFLAVMRAEAKRIALSRGWVSSDDLRVYGSQHNLEPTHPNAWGAVWREPGWSVVGYRKSAVPSAHARGIRMWAYTAQSDTERN